MSEILENQGAVTTATCHILALGTDCEKIQDDGTNAGKAAGPADVEQEGKTGVCPVKPTPLPSAPRSTRTQYNPRVFSYFFR
jgi:hypothetical protein